MNNLFVYGTLMCEEIFFSVTGIPLPCSRGQLQEYSRHPVAGQLYPGILPKKGATVDGLVYFDLPERLWSCLDRFEGEMYERRLVRVECRNDRKMAAWAYVVRPRFIPCLDKGKPWNFHNFLAVGKKTFQQDYQGYTACSGGDETPPCNKEKLTIGKP